MFANFGPGHWAVLAVAMILLFGAKKLPDAARSLGKSLRIFKSELSELQNEVKLEKPDGAPTRCHPSGSTHQWLRHRFRARPTPTLDRPEPIDDIARIAVRPGATRCRM
jgi:TatA/E family protein of Tat protein translocase